MPITIPYRRVRHVAGTPSDFFLSSLENHLTNTLNHQRASPILMEEKFQGNTAQLHSVQIGQALQVFLQVAAKERAQDLALSKFLDTVSKNLAYSRAYRLERSIIDKQTILSSLGKNLSTSP